ncbi:uncharacterized protein LOC62_06G008495 [Vanrija pseudolonga]|uniref:C2H2-type domain-containing protein n=1 Tax=Vanrija pseudolonga TaxID=143232 RepID=A0AAF1BQM0_9TREE|nr:hypothetical protein LOC62_06G008495 [Vanrija pseudolonga]
MPVIAPPASPHTDLTHRQTTGGRSASIISNNNNDMVEVRSPSPEPSASGSQLLRTSRPPASTGSSSHNGSSSARVPSPTRPALPSLASSTPAADFLRALGAGQRPSSQSSLRSPSAKGSRSPTKVAPASPSQASSSRSQATQRTLSPAKSPVRSEAQLIPLSEASPRSPRQRISLSSGPSSVGHMRKVDGAGTSPDTKGKGRQLTLANWLEPISEDGGVWRTPVRAANRAVVELPSPTPRRRVEPPAPLKIGPVNRAFVVLKIKASRRDELIAKGWYDRFRDDDDTPNQYHQKRGLRAAAAFGSSVMLRPAKGRLHGEIPRQARVREPEALPERFVHRPGPGLLEPWASVVNEESLLNRVNEYPCGWKGCDALLASEALLKKHVAFRAHAAQGAFVAGLYGEHTVYRCHWRGCTGPCFDEIWKLVQHMDAVHIGPKLLCPYEGCDLRSPSLHHLQRHVLKQHDLPDDYAHPLANRPFREDFDDDELAQLPDTAYTHELTTQPISGSWFKEPKQELLRKKVHAKCYAPEDPDIFHNHPPLMLDGELESDSAIPTAEGTEVASEFSVDVDAARPAKRRRLVPVVEIVRMSPSALRKYVPMPEPTSPSPKPEPAELVPPPAATDGNTSVISAAESDVESELFADELLDSSTFE